jgi:hypothetical protein
LNSKKCLTEEKENENVEKMLLRKPEVEPRRNEQTDI